MGATCCALALTSAATPASEKLLSRTSSVMSSGSMDGAPRLDARACQMQLDQHINTELSTGHRMAHMQAERMCRAQMRRSAAAARVDTLAGGMLAPPLHRTHLRCLVSKQILGQVQLRDSCRLLHGVQQLCACSVQDEGDSTWR
jgi:hypothetical protein